MEKMEKNVEKIEKVELLDEELDNVSGGGAPWFVKLVTILGGGYDSDTLK